MPDLAPPGRDLYVVVAATRWDGPAFTERHVAEALLDHGAVLWIEPPVSFAGARRRTDLADGRTRPGLVRVRPGLVRVVPPTPPVLPMTGRLGVHGLRTALHARAARSAVRRTGVRPRAVISFAARVDGFRAARDTDVPRVAWIKDDLDAGAGLTGVDGERIRRGRRRMLDEADLVVAVSPVLAERLRADGHDPLLLPAGADVRRFDRARDLPRPADVGLQPPYAGFVGQLGDRVDVALLEGLVADGSRLLLVGPMGRRAQQERWAPLLASPRVQWLGPRPYEELPAYMGSMAVGTVPYVRDDFNAASFPLKLLEYLSAGAQVVSTSLPAARWLDTTEVLLADDPDAFARATRDAISQHGARSIGSTQRVARAHSWSRRVAHLLARLERSAAHN